MILVPLVLPGATGPTGETGPTGPTGAAPTLNALNAVNVAGQTPGSAGDALTLDTNQVLEGSAITHTASSADIELTENGTYRVGYNTTVTTSGSASPPVTVSAQLENEGTEIPGTITSATLQSASNTANLAATAIIEVSSAPVTITLNANDTDAEYSNTSVVIRKLD